ncbi:MAG TPA: ABC transporter permease [Pyrinomonadaceae bacterium]|jgi:putative ABC transport system permease protein|nr:ABC transporter permease [Pyrinomonadaceae bacterium]
MHSLLHDFRYAIRSLRKRRAFTAIAVLTLALGIGANTAIFSVVNSVLLKPLPYQNSERLVMVWGNFQKLRIEHMAAKVAEFENYRAQERVFEQVAAFESQNLNLSSEGQAERINGARVTSNLFSMLGAQPIRGRAIDAAENQPGREKVAVISHAFWQHQFGGQEAVIGQTLRLDDADYTVIGIMPASFQWPHASLRFAQPADVWLPLTYTTEQVAQRRGSYRLNVIGLLKADVSVTAARAEMITLGEQFKNSYRGYRGPQGEDGGWQITVVPIRDEAVGDSGRALWLLFGAVGLVLLIACANVANLLVVHASLRQRELAVRAALGASRWRLARQLLAESLVLAIGGGGLGLLIAFWGVASLTKLQSANLPRLREIQVDGRVFVFTALLTIVTLIVFALLPALSAARFDLNTALKEKRAAALGSWRNHLGRNLLLVGEVALSFVLLLGAGLLVNSFLRLQRQQPALTTSQLLTADINLPESRYPETQQATAFFQDLVARLEALPGVEGATISTGRPLSGFARNDPFAIEGRALDPQNISFAGWQMVGANYFSTLGIPLVQGRDITLQDMDEQSPVVAVINQSMARRYWPNENPIGRRITLGLPRPDNPWVTIVGIAKDLPHRGVDSQPEPDWYITRPLGPQRNQVLFVRSSGRPAELGAATIRSSVTAIDRNQPVTNIKTLNEVVADTLAPRKFNMALFGLFAVLALVLAALGIYGVMTYSVTQRTHEIGIRMALGAPRWEVLGLIIKKGMSITMLGVILGVGVALALSRLLTALLFGISPTDKSTFIVVSAFVMLVAWLACYIPARRAAKVDPLIALRYE